MTSLIDNPLPIDRPVYPSSGLTPYSPYSPTNLDLQTPFASPQTSSPSPVIPITPLTPVPAASRRMSQKGVITSPEPSLVSLGNVTPQGTPGFAVVDNNSLSNPYLGNLDTYSQCYDIGDAYLAECVTKPNESFPRIDAIIKEKDIKIPPRKTSTTGTGTGTTTTTTSTTSSSGSISGKQKCDAVLKWARKNCRTENGMLVLRGEPLARNYITNCYSYMKATSPEEKARKACALGDLYGYLNEQKTRIQSSRNIPGSEKMLPNSGYIGLLENNLADSAENQWRAIQSADDYYNQCVMLKRILDNEILLSQMTLDLTRAKLPSKEKERQKESLLNYFIPTPFTSTPQFVAPVYDLLQYEQFRKANIPISGAKTASKTTKKT